MNLIEGTMGNGSTNYNNPETITTVDHSKDQRGFNGW